MTQNSLPVLVIGFNRPDLVERVLEAVRAYNPAALYLACDGPRPGNDSDRELVEKVRLVMEHQALPGRTKFLFRTENFGLREAVVGAIDWFFDNETEGIVLEDDCLPGPSFFEFCELILSRYRSDKSVWGVGGYNPSHIDFSGGSYGFIRYAPIWGWASWVDRWRKYDRELDKYQEEVIDGNFVWPSEQLYQGLQWHLQRALRQPKSWDYQLSWSVVAHNGLWAMPDRNLVMNLGFGSSSTHTRRQMFLDQEISQLSDIRHPEEVSVDIAAENEFLRRHLRVYKSRLGNYLRNCVRELKLVVKRVKG